jgi:hypothetical protein
MVTKGFGKSYALFQWSNSELKHTEMSWGAGEHLAVVMEEDPRVLIPLQQVIHGHVQPGELWLTSTR